MEKLAIISGHIVLLDYPMPVNGIILVDGGLIEDMIVLADQLPVDSIKSLYPDYKILDYQDFYISPGIIDLNTRKEWDSYSTFTKNAVSGGVVFLLEEPSFYNQTSTQEKLYCDVGTIQLIDDTNYQDLDERCFAYKAYLFPPTGTVKCLKDLSLISLISSRTQKAIFIDPNFPEERMLYMTSPHRHETADQHLIGKCKTSINIFAGAYGEEVKDSGSDDEDNSII